MNPENVLSDNNVFVDYEGNGKWVAFTGGQVALARSESPRALISWIVENLSLANVRVSQSAYEALLVDEYISNGWNDAKRMMAKFDVVNA